GSDAARGASGVLRHLATMLGPAAGPRQRAQQVRGAEDALQRAVQLLRETRHELSDVRELFAFEANRARRPQALAKNGRLAPPPALAHDEEGRERDRHAEYHNLHRSASSITSPCALSFSRCARTFSCGA